MSIGSRIKQRRKELNLSVDELAKRLGKNRATVYRYESDYIYKLPITVLEPLAKALECSPEYLMGWDDGENNENKTVRLNVTKTFSNRELLKEVEYYLNHSDEIDEFAKLLADYNKLNASGKEKANEYVADLTTISKYTENEN